MCVEPDLERVAFRVDIMFDGILQQALKCEWGEGEVLQLQYLGLDMQADAAQMTDLHQFIILQQHEKPPSCLTWKMPLLYYHNAETFPHAQ